MYEIRVVPDSNKWKVVSDSGELADNLHGSSEAAVRSALEIAKTQKPALVTLYAHDGTVTQTWEVGRFPFRRLVDSMGLGYWVIELFLSGNHYIGEAKRSYERIFDLIARLFS